MVRALPCHGRGCGFESRRSRQMKQNPLKKGFCFGILSRVYSRKLMVDCEKLNPNAQKIFENLKPYFPPNPWKKPCWEPEGRVCPSGNTIWYDLRKSADRNKLIDQERETIGHQTQIAASIHQQNNKCVPNGELGWLKDFTFQHFPRSMQHGVELLLLLLDLDFQIETGDIVER